MSAPLSHRERDNGYFGEIVRHGNHRVISCRDNTQWIIQRQKGGTEGRWISLHYCRSQAALIRLWPHTSPALGVLPKTYGGATHGAT